MAQVRLGRITLHWCPSCNVPLLEAQKCARCGGAPRSVALTPPGDARPAFPFDISMIKKTADDQFGAGAGKNLLPDGEIVLLNRIPDIDRSDEIIAGGEVIANYTYILGRGFALQLRMPGALRIGVPEKGWVLADKGAIPSILGSSNLLGPGVVECSPGISPFDELIMLRETGPPKEIVECQSGAPQYERVYVLRKEASREVIATGSTRMSSEDMTKRSKGTAVKVRWKLEEGAAANIPAKHPSVPDIARGANWDDVRDANRDMLGAIVKKAVGFIKEGASQLKKPVAVSYSGGKDSLACLLLALDAGLQPTVLFIDTGLEFPETVENAVNTARTLGLLLITENAGEAFWDNLQKFGPPAKDYRWCCKCCKLGPVTRAITKHYPDGVISLIGQRRYESAQRAAKGNVWKNPWVPGQIGASPIQEWTALAIWLYLFSKKASYNPWYERGLERIGCFLCPATNLADLILVARSFPGYARWEKALEGYPKVRKEYGLWRWRHLPRGVQEFLSQKGIVAEKAPHYPGRLELTAGAPQPFDSAISAGKFAVEGKFSRSLDIGVLATRLLALGKVEKRDDALTIAHHTELYADGKIVVRGETAEDVQKRVAALKEAVIRAEECAGCGICAGRCPSGAASVSNGRMNIDARTCTMCGACLTGPCPATAYGNNDEEDA